MLDTLLIIVVTAAVTLTLSILKRNLVTPERKLDYQIHELALAGLLRSQVCCVTKHETDGDTVDRV